MNAPQPEKRKKTQPVQMRVHSSERLTSNMQRLLLVSSDGQPFPPDTVSGYIKLMFHMNGQPVEQPHDLDMPNQLMRTYTIRDVDNEQNGITVDFVLHGNAAGSDSSGPASSWAASAQPGDCIMVGGPGPAKWLQPPFDWVLMASDLTGLPALACNLERLADEAVGYAVIQVPHMEDIQPLRKPANMELIWVIDDEHPSADEAARQAPLSKFLQQLQSLAWLPGEPSVWAACEFHKMRELRKYVREQEARRSHTYISSYWKVGRSEDQHKLDKKADAAVAG